MFDKLGLRKNNSRFFDLCGHTYLNVIPQVKLNEINYYFLFLLPAFKQKSHKETFVPKVKKRKLNRV